MAGLHMGYRVNTITMDTGPTIRVDILLMIEILHIPKA